MSKNELVDMTVQMNKALLEAIYKQAVSSGEELWPDEAFKKMNDCMARQIKEEDGRNILGDRQIDLIAIAKKSHIHAVELFYKTYFPRRGAPPISKEHKELLLRRISEGLSYKELARELYPNLKNSDDIKKAAERIRKLIDNEKKRRNKQIS